MCPNKRRKQRTVRKFGVARGPIQTKSRSSISGPCLVLDVKDVLLDLGVNGLGRLDKGLLDIGGVLGRSLHEDEAVFPRKLLAFLACDGTL